jgi:hypothetical protein
MAVLQPFWHTPVSAAAMLVICDLLKPLFGTYVFLIHLVETGNHELTSASANIA